ncbi:MULTISPECIES: TetR/AcrR family transcriptional regulator [Comamonas]|uniref:TetR/AcrR family transcriptional regulator n=1 Tax=Comamonas squillarum TaxID=2977320 RepID=A0ABY6A1K7_9BURK|nr:MULTISPECIES: TetR/AcrR family transcriptional regulator [Comamonas]PWB19824.1 TetR/AcrR family transcriptional regulator [Comamonas sp. JNW]UXC18872.1 TetR/AcrR family transcriptional regulator [Comamonas sp. PR12]
MPSAKSSSDTLAPRERILVAAHALFYQDGIRATGVDKIIDQASVSKVTFYRQYPSKDELIRAYLDYRHGIWMSWFEMSLTQALHAGAAATLALSTTLRTWFSRADFRGCAFLNAAAELGSSNPEILKVVRQHKQEMAAVLDSLLASDGRPVGHALSLVIDGAIVHAQMGQVLDDVMDAFNVTAAAMLQR